METLKRLLRMPLWWWALAALSTAAAVVVFIRYQQEAEREKTRNAGLGADSLGGLRDDSWIATLH